MVVLANKDTTSTSWLVAGMDWSRDRKQDFAKYIGAVLQVMDFSTVHVPVLYRDLTVNIWYTTVVPYEHTSYSVQ